MKKEPTLLSEQDAKPCPFCGCQPAELVERMKDHLESMEGWMPPERIRAYVQEKVAEARLDGGKSVIRSVSEFLDLVHEQRIYGWHDLQDGFNRAVDELRAASPSGDLPNRQAGSGGAGQ